MSDFKKRRPKIGLAVFLLPMILIEVVFLFAEQFYVTENARNWAIQNFAFWVGLLTTWQPNYSSQPVLMFFTYSFLHTGLYHLTGNMVCIYLIYLKLLNGVSFCSFVLIFFISSIGGASLFALLAESIQPMIGASGAIFGLFAVCLFLKDGCALNKSLTIRQLLLVLVFLIFLNFVSWVLLGGLLAWQTHLGGFLAGAIYAIIHNRWSSNGVPE